MNRILTFWTLLAVSLLLTGCTSEPSDFFYRNPYLLKVKSPQPIDADREALVTGMWISQSGGSPFSFDGENKLAPTSSFEDCEKIASTAWSIVNGNVLIGCGDDADMLRFVSSTILMYETSYGDVAYLRKIDETGLPIPVPVEETVLQDPLFDSSSVTSIRYESSYAPAPSGREEVEDIQFTLEMAKIGMADPTFLGTAIYNVPDEDWITGTVGVHLSETFVDETLALVANAPVWHGPYRSHITHTDDYPRLRLTVMVNEKEYIFGTRSQGESHIPWQVLVDDKEYVTFSYAVADALRNLQSALHPQIPWYNE